MLSLCFSKDFTFYKYYGTKDFVDKSFPDSKANYLKHFQDGLEEFYLNTQESKPNNTSHKT